MAKERLHELTETDSQFQLRGIVTNTKAQRFYRSGTGKNGGAWNSMEFGVKIGDNKTVFVSMSGFPRPEVFYHKKGENGSKGDTKRVPWKDRNNSPGNGYRLIGVNISTGKDENGKNVNETFTEFDAIEWLHDNLKDGESVFIKGKLRFSSYEDKKGQTHKKTELVPTQISYTQKPVDFDSEDYKEMAEFENTIIFSDISKEEDKNGKATGRFVLSGFSIGYNTVEPVSFIIDAEHAKVAGAIKKKMKPGNSIKTYGRVCVKNNIESVQIEDDGWGSTETSPMERINSPVIREYVVYKVDGSTFDTKTYSEEAIGAAIRKIKAAKTATENFGDKANANIDIEVDEDWGNSDAFDDEDSPW